MPGMGIGPPGEFSNLAVKTSTPVSVTSSVCSISCYVSVPKLELSFERCLLTKLCCPFAVRRSVCPIIRPTNFSIAAQGQNRLNRECHPRFTSSYSLVLRVVGDPRRRVKLRIDTVAAPSFNNGKVPRGCVLLNDLAELSNRHTRFYDLDCHVQGLPRCFNKSYRVRVSSGLVTNIVGLIQVGVIAAVV